MIAIELEFSLATIQKLIILDSDVNAQDCGGLTPIHYCFYRQNYAMFDFLLSVAGADPDI